MPVHQKGCQAAGYTVPLTKCSTAARTWTLPGDDAVHQMHRALEAMLRVSVGQWLCAGMTCRIAGPGGTDQVLQRLCIWPAGVLCSRCTEPCLMLCVSVGNHLCAGVPWQSIRPEGMGAYETAPACCPQECGAAQVQSTGGNAAQPDRHACCLKRGFAAGAARPHCLTLAPQGDLPDACRTTLQQKCWRQHSASEGGNCRSQSCCPWFTCNHRL